MKDAQFTIDSSQIRKMFAELTSKQRKKVFRKAVQGGLNIVKKQAVRNLKNAVSSDAINRKDKYGNTLRKGIKVKVYRDNQSGVIHIMGNYKLKFFELGTNQRFNRTRNGRQLRKRRNTGCIKAYHFFKSAKQSKETEVFNNIDRLLAQSIQKINNKYR